MHKFILPLVASCLFSSASFAQKVSGKLIFEQGKTYTVTIDQKSTITQEAMGQTIDFTTSGLAVHSYKVTNATPDNSTLHHESKRLSFNFNGMGAKKPFDSDNKTDMDGEYGKPIGELLSKSYDIIVDGSGKTLLSRPEKIELAKTDDRMAMITNMMKDMTDIVQPPTKGTNSFFKILPDRAVAIGDIWTDSIFTASMQSATLNTLSAITDSTILVDYKTSSVTNTTSEIMGMEATSKLTSISTGQITLNKATGIIKQKTVNTTSKGTTEVMGTEMPIEAKSTVVITVQ